MIDITALLVGIPVLFAFFLTLRAVLPFKVCALCAAVSAAWIVLLALLQTGTVVSPVTVAILMGGSVVGVMYLLEEKLPERYRLFKLPFFLTLVFGVSIVLEKGGTLTDGGILLFLWVFSAVLYAGRNVPALKRVGKNIIECCKNW